jgi:exonuclease SbcC
VRPISLVLQAFASFPAREEVDFLRASARGLFVVTGPTGGGKTSIFDAVCYALYGRLPGVRGGGEVRSHHARADDETYVELTFEVRGQHYTVHRAPAQQRPKQRGGGTTRADAAAWIVRREPSGGTTPLAGKPNEVAELCRQLVGLDAEQFQRVILLPQGQFAEFLLARDEAREKLLRHLFGGELYERAVSWLEAHERALGTKVAEVEAAISHHRQNVADELDQVRVAWLELPSDPHFLADAPDEVAEAAIEALEPERIRQQSARDALEAAAIKAEHERAEAERVATAWDERLRWTRARDEREAERGAREDDERRVALSAAARPVVSAARELESARLRHVAAAAAVDRRRSTLAADLARLGLSGVPLEPAQVATTAAEERQRCKASRDMLDKEVWARRQAEEKQAAHAAATSRRQALNARRVEADADLVRRLDLCEITRAMAATREARQAGLASARSLLVARGELDEAMTAGARARAEAETRQQAYENTMRLFVATQAPRLASTLEDGTPCPVCGSSEHPSPARSVAGPKVDHAAVDTARAAWASALARASESDARARAATALLGDWCSQPREALVALVTRHEAALREAVAAADALPACERALEEGERGKLHLEAEVQRATASEATAAEAARAAAAEARALQDLARDIDPRDLDARETASLRLESGAEELGRELLQLAASQAAMEAAQGRLEQAFQESTLSDVLAATALVLPAAEEAELRRRVQAWRDALARATPILEQFALQGLPAERPQTTTLSEGARTARAAALAARDGFAAASASLTEARRQLALARGRAAASADLREQHRSARVVAQTCNGDAGMRVRLERWVLAGELDRVSRHANRHLTRMTRGRYQMRRTEGQARFALALEILDADTGRGRPVSSLSGGEQFQASLALALGLADVVGDDGASHAGPFNALFIDEGFGSLDDKALAEAVETLRGLQAGGRMIGAITHVQAMRAELPVGIEVLQRSDGHGSRIVVPE